MGEIEKEKKYTDEQLLYNCFDIIIHQINSRLAIEKSDPSYWWRDGFEEPIDEGELCPLMHDLAKRLNYKLVDGMWVDIPIKKGK